MPVLPHASVHIIMCVYLSMHVILQASMKLILRTTVLAMAVMCVCLSFYTKRRVPYGGVLGTTIVAVYRSNLGGDEVSWIVY